MTSCLLISSFFSVFKNFLSTVLLQESASKSLTSYSNSPISWLSIISVPTQRKNQTVAHRNLLQIQHLSLPVVYLHQWATQSRHSLCSPDGDCRWTVTETSGFLADHRPTWKMQSFFFSIKGCFTIWQKTCFTKKLRSCVNWKKLNWIFFTFTLISNRK